MIKTSFLISLLTKFQTYAECGKKPKVNDARVTETCEEWSENGKCRRFSYYCEDDWATKPAAVDKDGNKVTFSSLSCMESEDLNKVTILMVIAKVFYCQLFVGEILPTWVFIRLNSGVVMDIR